MELEKNYLVFPTSRTAAERRMRLLRGGEVLAEYQIRFDPEHPDFTAYLDVRRFRGETLTVSIEPPCEVPFRQTEEPALPDLYREPLRPQVHFSVKTGWNNDPNGLVFLNGVYHMFYQYGPCTVRWNNMHWGHAVSRDLVHWQELPCALCPDERGMPFSGSAAVDTENRSGLGRDDTPPVLFFYTATGLGFTLEHGGDNFTQCLAYSTDGCRSLRRYEGNPVLPHRCSGNRDPRVIFCEELGCWLMALYAEDDIYWIFQSQDLLHWAPHQTLRLPGDNECPDLYPVTAEDGTRKWIFSGAHDIYLVGAFRDGLFCPEQPPRPLSYGGLVYAAQTFANLPGGVVRIAWLQTRIPEARFSQQMGFPTEMSLCRRPDGWRLAASPVGAIRTLYRAELERTRLLLETETQLALPEGACDLSLRFAGDSAGTLCVALFGLTLCCDFDRRVVSLNGTEAPFWSDGGVPELRLLFDRCTAELFLDGGTVLLAVETYPDFCQSTLTLRPSRPLKLERLHWAALSSIWEEHQTPSTEANPPLK